MSLKEKINSLGKSGEPFVFCINYNKTDGFAYKKSELPPNIKISFGKAAKKAGKNQITKKEPISFEAYEQKISKLKEHIKDGDIYLANLTCETKVEIEGAMGDIFDSSSAEFLLLVEDEFSVHSPEEFVRIEGGIISTYPMKGTAVYDGEASIQKLLDNPKELAEHTMVVDLLRNDLSIVAGNVRVDKFRYPVLTPANGQELIQIVSKISGTLDDDYTQRLGDILFAMLPAGSITGTPKKKCVEILKDIEGYDRGYYCGVFGEFDGKNLRSAVAIRYIEKQSGGYVYKSGGGITLDSDAKDEYAEMIKKVYLAF